MKALWSRKGRDEGEHRQGKGPALRRLGLWVFLVSFAILAAIAHWRGIALPVSWTGRLLDDVASEWGADLSAKRVSWAGGNTVVLHDVILGVSGLSGHAARVEVEIGWEDLVPVADGPAQRRLNLQEALLVLPGPAQEILGPLTVHRGEVRLSADELLIEQLTFSAERLRGRAEGLVVGLGGDSPRLDVRARLEEWDAEAATRLLEALALGSGEGRLGNWDGTLTADLRLSGTLGDLEVSWQAEARDVVWDGGKWYSHGYRIQSWESAGRVETASGLVTIERFSAQAAPWDAGISPYPANNEVRRLEVSGTLQVGSGPAGEDAPGTAGLQETLHLDVAADGLIMEQDVPRLRDWGVSGRGTFTGQLVGSMTSPRLTGTLALRGGTLWHQPFEAAQGHVEWTPGSFTVTGAEVTEGGSLYRIDSHLAFAEGDDVLTLSLESVRGRAETLLAIVGWDSLPLQGTLDGFLRFEGPVGSLESYGSLAITDGEGWKQPFEEISVTYRWDERGLSLSDGVVRLGGGVGQFAGTVSPAGELDLDVQAVSLPLEALAAVRNTHPGLLTGRADFRGSLKGTLDSPRWEGHVAGRRLRLGPVAFDQGSGYVALEDGGWEIRDLELIRPEGARYSGSGWVNARAGFPPVLQLLVEVEGEGLEQVLEMLGIQLGYPLASGIVEGRAFLVGELGRPDGEIVLTVRDAELMGRPTGLAVELELAGGQVRVKDLSLGRIEA